MKKILLIEDRTVRQQLFMQETKINLGDYNDVLENCTDNLYIELELQIENNNFDLTSYDYIISHKSAFGKKNSELLSKLNDFCANKSIPLILFSGGISVNYYNNGQPELLELNSKTFYSDNLVLFLKALRDENENLLMLCYGEKWKQNIVSNMIEKINIYVEKNDKEKVNYIKFANEVSVKNLKSLQYRFYNINTQNPLINIDEIFKLRSSLYVYLNTINVKYLDTIGETLNTILIHNNNIVNLQQFDDLIHFTPSVSDIDEYISKDIITEELQDQEFDVIFIKDNLSLNYLELYGLRVAYHIRLSKELEDRKNVPIVIVSDFSADMLNKFEPMARILFTKNIFLIENTKEAIEKTKTIDFNNLTSDEYQTEFLDKIKVEQPKDYLTHHGIANEWSMYRWAEYLNVNTPDIEKIRDEISSMLYFKYLQAKFPIKRSLFSKHKQGIQGEGKILYIDDEWEKGWRSIFEHLSLENQDYSLETVEEVYKDKSQEEIITFIMDKVMSVDPDVIILDMRLHKDDFLEGKGLADFTGIQIFNQIKEINPGIQVIIFTASSNSLLLDELYSYDSSILGYVKKEHPKDYNLTTQGNINKLVNFINKGLENKYLKKIYITSNLINKILNINVDEPTNNLQIFEKFYIKKSRYLSFAMKLHKETNYVFNILDSNSSNKYPYAMLSIARSLEAILSIFIIERQYDKLFWDGEDCSATSFEDKITDLMKKFGNNNITTMKDKPEKDKTMLNIFIKRRNDYIHSNPSYKEVSKDEIGQWFHILLDIIKVIDSPPNYTPYTPKIKKHHDFRK